ncbi:MAG: nitroreductase family protein [Desertifilum sp.]|nr:nitroreductase family protein [Desertifilum sp.]
MKIQPTYGLKDAIEQRRAERSFKSDPIPEVLLEEIFRLGLRSPSGYNLQPWRFIVVRDPENRDRLKACAFNQRQVGEAPLVLICCGDRRVSQSDYIESVIELGKQHDAVPDAYADYIRQAIPQLFENHPCFESVEAWTNRHTMLAVAHLMIVAKSFGVDSCPMEGFVSTQVKEAFKIPDEVDVCCLLPMGYAAEEPKKAYGGRFDVEQVFFAESFGEQFRF